jgi:hypothetical protein
VSEQQAEQTGDELAALSAGPAVSGSAVAPSKTMLAEALARTIASAAGVVPVLMPRQASRTSDPGASNADVAKPEVIKPDAQHAPGKATITSSGDRAQAGKGKVAALEVKTGPSQGIFSKRRRSLLALVVLLASAAGALGGALATAGITHFVGNDATNAGNPAPEASVARIDADILALKASVEQNAQLGTSQFNRTSDRLDQVEKAQAELAARPAKLGEAAEKPRAVPQVAVAAATVGVKEATGSIAPPAPAAPPSAPKLGQAKLPTVQGWVLRDVTNGGAVIQGKQGMFEVFAGDLVPGLGRIDAVRRQDGHWVVVTTQGLVVGR